MTKRILVIGATGNQGGAFIKAILGSKNKWKIRALTRDPNSAKAKALAEQGIEVVAGDINNKQDIEKALKDCYGVFFITTFQSNGIEGERIQCKNIADSIAKSDITHVVYTSGLIAIPNTGVSNFETKFINEQYLNKLKLPLTIIRPGSFFENYKEFLSRFMSLSLQKTLMDPDKKAYYTALQDIGDLAAYAFDHPAELIGETINLTTEYLSYREVVAKLKKANLLTPAITLPNFLLKKIPFGVPEMFRYFNKDETTFDIKTLTKKYSFLRDFDTWAKQFNK